MKLIKGFLYLSAAAALALSSCAKEESESYEKYENLALQAYMAKYHGDSKDRVMYNYQPVGDSGYYVDVIDPGSPDAAPLSDEETWVSFDFSGRDLNGNVILTRRAEEADLVGKFSKYTHYVPFYRFLGKENSNLLEGAYLAMRSKLVLDQQYADQRGLPTEVQLRHGAKVVLYMPSMLVGQSGVEGSGGYEGQTSLSSQRPFRVELVIRDTIKNPLQREGTDVDDFSKLNGGLWVYNKEDHKIPTDPTDPHHPYNPASERWVSASDTIPQLYVNYRFNPKTDRFTFPKPYTSRYAPYNDLTLEQRISEALVKRFHEKEEYKGVADLYADSVKLDGTAKIWYIGRFLDGFIFDTNIDEVKEIIYGKGKFTTGSALSYKPSDESLIQAFYYAVPKLQFGQWATLITTSTYAYGSKGKEASTSTSSSGSTSSYNDYINYLNYSNNYYGDYYGGYYGDYYGGYGGYGGGYYGDYYGSSYDTSTNTTTTTISTEIAPFAPLIFEFYIEPKSK